MAVLWVLSLMLLCVQAIYEDQAGRYDWHAKYVGGITTQVSDHRAMLVYTDLNILAAINPKSGELLWRRKFLLDDVVVGDLVLSGDEVVTYHASHRFRRWDILTGMLSTDTDYDLSDDVLFHTSLAPDCIIRVTRTSIQVGSSGKTENHPINIPFEMSLGGITKWGSVVEGFFYDSGSLTAKIVRYDGAKKSVSVVDVDLSWASPDMKFVSSEETLAALKGEMIFYKVAGADSFKNAIFSEIGVTWSVDRLESAGKSIFITSGNGKSAILAVRDGYMKGIKAINKEVTGQISGADFLVTISKTDSVVSLVQISNGFEHHSYELENIGRGEVKSIAVLTSSHPCSIVDTVKVPGLLLTWDDMSITAVGPNKDCGWTREENLAYVVSAVLVDLPASSYAPVNIYKHTNPLRMWVDRVLGQLSDIQKMANVHFGGGFLEGSPLLERDSFNLNKLIFVVTESGKTHVLHSTTGRIVWSRYLSNIAPLDENKYSLYIVRSASHYPLPALVAILSKNRGGEGALLTVLNPLDGTTQYTKLFKSKLTQVQLTNVEDNEFAKVLLILTSDNQVHTYPPGLQRLVKDTPLYFSLFHTDKMQIQGLRLIEGGVEETWSTLLRGDKVVGITTKPTNDAVYSQGRVLGDRSVLHKYINPNVMALAVQTGTGDKGQVDIHMYDMISGEQLYHSRHKQYTGPVHLLVAENWMVYHMWNSKLRRFEVVVVEFFLPTAPNTTEFSSLQPHLAAFSIQQAYISTTPISAITVTTTLKSITNRAVIFAETSGRVSVVPKSVLDPRRPTMPTAEDRVEQLVPYSPQITMSPLSYLSYNKTIQDIRGMITGCTGLESTSLLFVYGTDLFFSRLTPAKTFDMLNEDFDHWLIGAVLLALCLATIATQALAENKTLNKKWK